MMIYRAVQLALKFEWRCESWEEGDAEGQSSKSRVGLCVPLFCIG